MNCTNHPTAEVTAYCQQCGKPLCAECVRAVGGQIFCEPCLQARLGFPAAGQNPGTFSATHANPALAALLGFIPGVGAMYNSQFAKALAHVVIFAVFVSLSHESLLFALLVPAWVLYQVFDAYQTAKARRDGLPLPNPFGLNDLGSRMGVPPSPSSPSPWTSTTSETPAQTGALASAASFSPDAASPGASPATSVPPPVSRTPVGAIVLIAVGSLLLLHTLGILSGEWIGRSWPLLIVGLGVWLLYRRMHPTPPGGIQ